MEKTVRLNSRYPKLYLWILRKYHFSDEKYFIKVVTSAVESCRKARSCNTENSELVKLAFAEYQILVVETDMEPHEATIKSFSKVIELISGRSRIITEYNNLVWDIFSNRIFISWPYKKPINQYEKACVESALAFYVNSLRDPNSPDKKLEAKVIENVVVLFNSKYDQCIFKSDKCCAIDNYYFETDKKIIENGFSYALEALYSESPIYYVDVYEHNSEIVSNAAKIATKWFM